MAAEQSWRYKVKLNDPLEAKKVLKELTEVNDDDEDVLTELDISDDFECPVKGCIVNRNGTEDLIALDEKPIRLDYTAQTIQLPEELVELYPLDESSVPAKHVRYVGMPTGGFKSERNEGDVVVLSLWNAQRDIVNVNLLAEDSMQAMILLNAVTRLVFDSTGKSSIRTHKFYPIEEGPVDVTWCSSAERDKMDEEKERRGLARKQQFAKAGVKIEQSMELGEEFLDRPMLPKFYVFDEEALLLYDYAFAPVPAIDLRFYREEKHPKAIETIFVCKIENQLEIQQGTRVYIIRARKGDQQSEDAHKKLIKFLRKGRVLPKFEDAFKGTGIDFEKIFSPKATEPYETDSDEALGDLKGNPIVNAVPKKTKYSKKVSAEPSGSRPSGLSGNMTKVSETILISKEDDDKRNTIWLENMLTANHVTEVARRTDDPESAHMQEEWFKKEAELQEILDKGTAPEVDPNDPLTNWDPKSLTDMGRALNLTRDSIMTNRYDEALQRLRRCLSFFDKTLLEGIEQSVGLVEVMKRIYFLQDRPTGM